MKKEILEKLKYSYQINQLKVFFIGVGCINDNTFQIAVSKCMSKEREKQLVLILF